MELDSTGERNCLMTKKGFAREPASMYIDFVTRGGKGVSTYDKTKFFEDGSELVEPTPQSKDDEIMLIKFERCNYQNQS